MTGRLSVQLRFVAGRVFVAIYGAAATLSVVGHEASMEFTRSLKPWP